MRGLALLPLLLGAACADLGQAVRTGDDATALALIAEERGLRQVDERGFLPLHEAARQGDLALVAAMLEAGVPVDARTTAPADDTLDGDLAGWTAAHLAALDGHAEVLSLLHAHDADLDARNGFGETPLHLAVRQDHLALIDLLLELPDVELDAPDEGGFTPLHSACQLGATEVALQLLEAGADPDALCGWGTALDVALGAGAPEPLLLDLTRRGGRERDLENRLRMQRLRDYEAGFIREDDLLEDGWTFHEPRAGYLGIVALRRSGGRTEIELGTSPWNPTFQRRALMVGLDWRLRVVESGRLGSRAAAGLDAEWRRPESLTALALADDWDTHHTLLLSATELLPDDQTAVVTHELPCLAYEGAERLWLLAGEGTRRGVPEDYTFEAEATVLARLLFEDGQLIERELLAAPRARRPEGDGSPVWSWTLTPHGGLPRTTALRPVEDGTAAP